MLSALVHGQSQQAYIDSLKHELAIHAEQDTNRAMVLYRLCNAYSRINYDTAEIYGNQALQLSMELDFQKGIGASFNNLGLVYEKKGEDVRALKYYTLALDAKRKTGDVKSTASTLNNIGIIYKKQEYYSKAIEYYREAMSLNKASGNRQFLLINYYNIANCHKKLNNGDSAMYYYGLGSDLALELKAWSDYVGILTSVGNYYLDNKEYEKGLQFVDSAHAIAQLYHANEPQDIYCEAKGRGFLGLNQLDSAEYYLDRELEITNGTKSWGPITQGNLLLAQLYVRRYRATGNDSALMNGYHHLELAYAARDSTVSTKRLNTIFEMVTDDLIDQKNAEIKAVQQEKELADLKSTKDRQFRNFVIALALAISLVLVVLWMRYRKNKELNRELADKNVQIENKNREIIDSITYAKRLQEAILPQAGYVKQFLHESFVLYLPKDIVAGDFYWMETSGDRLFIAAADCTGHGVPGAMVSVVCANALERSVNEFGIRNTAGILDKTRSLVMHAFEKSAAMVNDGMDISLLALPLNSTGAVKAQWSGAFNPLVVVRDGKILEWKADKQPVGNFEIMSPFTAHELELQPNDWVYLFTDGYADQFGGPKGKKFKYATLKERLVEISKLHAHQQLSELESTLNSWRGTIEQVDDICVIGLKI